MFSIFLGLLSTLASADTLTSKSPFLWGVANSSFQVEGSPAPSDWKLWTETPGRIHDNSNAQSATEFWQRHDQDFTLAQDMGANAFRVSLAWERIEPKDNLWDEEVLLAYEKMLTRMRLRGLEPIVTLYHWPLPLWLALKGGLTSDEFPQQFKDYALKVIARLSQKPAQVKYWITFNEPNVVSRLSYSEGLFPPGKKGAVKDNNIAIAHQAQAHIDFVKALRNRMPELKLQIGVSQHWRDFQTTGNNPFNHALKELSHWSFNRQFLDAVTGKRFIFWMPGSDWIHKKLPENISYVDFIGINYYGRMMTHLSLKAPYILVTEGPGPKSDLGWEIYPEGLYRSLKTVYEKYKLPILVSENGLADAKNEKRTAFLRDHIFWMNKARQEKVPVLGYLHWSLTDNFEWAEGLTPRFGLVAIDYKSQKRTPRPSYFEFQKIIRASQSE